MGCTCTRYGETVAKNSYGNGAGKPDTISKSSKSMTPYAMGTLLPKNPYW
jgi:hypothetical protein